MVKLDEKAYNFLRTSGVTLEGESVEDLEVRIEITDSLQKGQIGSKEELDSTIGGLFEEIGIQATEDDINRVEENIVKRRKSHLIESIMNYTRVLKYQNTQQYRDLLEESQSEFDRLEQDPSSYFTSLFQSKQKK